MNREGRKVKVATGVTVNEQYAGNWLRCPFCGGLDIESYRPEVFDFQIIQTLVCAECHEDWDEVYVASHRERAGDVIPGSETAK